MSAATEKIIISRWKEKCVHITARGGKSNIAFLNLLFTCWDISWFSAAAALVWAQPATHQGLAELKLTSDWSEGSTNVTWKSFKKKLSDGLLRLLAFSKAARVRWVSGRRWVWLNENAVLPFSTSSRRHFCTSLPSHVLPPSCLLPSV